MQIQKNTFKKKERLKSKKIIEQLFKSGEIIHQYPFKVLFINSIDQNTEYQAQIAISVSKRNFKKAVDRNYIKRKIREAYRKNKINLYNHLIENDQKLSIFVIYTANRDLHYTEIEKSMQLLIEKISNRIKQQQHSII